MQGSAISVLPPKRGSCSAVFDAWLACLCGLEVAKHRFYRPAHASFSFQPGVWMSGETKAGDNGNAGMVLEAAQGNPVCKFSNASM